MRGDVPVVQQIGVDLGGFSPRARGCSALTGIAPVTDLVFPACAGMFPGGVAPGGVAAGFPRVRGDVPAVTGATGHSPPFSPRARGCSSKTRLIVKSDRVFPACAGMFRTSSCLSKSNTSFPRVRGDVPLLLVCSPQSLSFSPRARGCSRLQKALETIPDVFPACAGMFLRVHATVRFHTSFPRVRGDVPPIASIISEARRFSPRARGCSDGMRFCDHDLGVFPACAGMFPRSLPCDDRPFRFPRVRGDVPWGCRLRRRGCRFSPRARGCSRNIRLWKRLGGVFPACAGMFRCVTVCVTSPPSFPRVRGDVPICYLKTQ